MSYNNVFPMRYCIIGLEKFSHYDNDICGLKPVNEVYAYVVAKCYLVKETTIYNKDGSTSAIYGVVPTWKQNEKKHIEPEYDWNNECINAMYTKYIFDDLNEAKCCSRKLNAELIEIKLMKCDYDNDNELIKELEYDIQEAYKIEEKHLKKNNKTSKKR